MRFDPVLIENGGQIWRWLLRSTMPFLVLVAALMPLAEAAAEPLVYLGRPGIWPAVSGLIVYDGRLWLTNSQPYEDNNAADIYSYDPGTSTMRFERGLFSQDVGVPTVSEGLLYLPYEDPRFNMSAGEYAVTDGEAWRWRRLPEGTAFHTHAMGHCGDDLLVSTGAWEGQLHVSPDDGRTWRLAATYPSGEASFSRLIAIASFKDRCFIGASAFGRKDGKLLEWKDGSLTPVPGWPIGDRTDRLVVWNGRLLAINRIGRAINLLAFDGTEVSPVSMPPKGSLRDLATDRESLWAVTGGGAGGSLWHTQDGVAWDEIQTFDETPIAVAAFAGDAFVGTFAAGGGSFYGPGEAADMHHVAPATPFGPSLPDPVPPVIWQKAEAAMDAYIDQRTGAKAGLEAVSDALRQLTVYQDPDIGKRLSERLAALDIEGVVRFLSWERTKRAHKLGWYLLGAIAVNGEGRVPPDLLATPLSSWNNDEKKNLDTPIAAIATVGWIGQADRQTLNDLMDRLRRAKKEPWLTSDIIAALTALTGLEFGHDRDRWQAWWDQQR